MRLSRWLCQSEDMDFCSVNEESESMRHNFGNQITNLRGQTNLRNQYVNEQIVAGIMKRANDTVGKIEGKLATNGLMDYDFAGKNSLIHSEDGKKC